MGNHPDSVLSVHERAGHMLSTVMITSLSEEGEKFDFEMQKLSRAVAIDIKTLWTATRLGRWNGTENYYGAAKGTTSKKSSSLTTVRALKDREGDPNSKE